MESPLCATCNHRLSQHYHGDIHTNTQRCVGLDLLVNETNKVTHEWCTCTQFVPIPIKENESENQED